MHAWFLITLLMLAPVLSLSPSASAHGAMHTSAPVPLLLDLHRSQETPSSREISAKFQGDQLLVKDQEGRLLWSVKLPPGSSHGIAAHTEQFDWIIAFKCSPSSLCMRRYDRDGHELWQQLIDEDRYPGEMRVAADGSYLLELNFAVSSPVLAKYDAHGQALWRWESQRHYFVGMEFTQDGGIVVLGNLSRVASGFWLTKLDQNGSIQWAKDIVPPGKHRRWWASALRLNPTGDIVVSGEEFWRKSTRATWKSRPFSQTWRKNGRDSYSENQTTAHRN